MMEFSLNMMELYRKMANELGETVDRFMTYEEFVEEFALAILEDINVKSTASGDFFVVFLEVDE